MREALAADSAILAQNAGCHALDDDPATCHDPLQSRGPCTCAPRIMYLCVRLAVLPRTAIRIFLLGCPGDSANSRPAVTAVAATSGSHLPVRAKINCILGGWILGLERLVLLLSRATLTLLVQYILCVR